MQQQVKSDEIRHHLPSGMIIVTIPHTVRAPSFTSLVAQSTSLKSIVVFPKSEHAVNCDETMTRT
jgi:hypothetical protein